MSDVLGAVVVAVITGIFALSGQIVLSRFNSEKMLKEIEKRSELTDVKLEGQITSMKDLWNMQLNQLTQSVNKHNGFAERIPVLEEKIKTLESRVADLERHGGT